MITMLQAAAAQQPQGAGWTFWIMIGAMILIMWLFMWRPESKRRKQMQEFIANLKKGDKIITAGGIYGVIKEVNETTFLIEVAKDVVIKMDKGSIYVAADDVHQAQATGENK